MYCSQCSDGSTTERVDIRGIATSSSLQNFNVDELLTEAIALNAAATSRSLLTRGTVPN